MRHLTLTLILLFVSLSSSQVTVAGSPEQSVKDFMQVYLDGYEKYLKGGDNADVTTVTDHFSEPLVMMPPQGAVPMATHADFAPNIKYFLDEVLKKKGVVKLKWTKLQIAILSDTQALASGLADALDKDGNTVEQRASIYLITKSEKGWEVAVNLPHSPTTMPTIN